MWVETHPSVVQIKQTQQKQLTTIILRHNWSIKPPDAVLQIIYLLNGLVGVIFY